MTTTKSGSPHRVWPVAFLMLLTVFALVQTRSAAASQDMRLWSFGDCERRFPNAEAEDYKECMRVVGSVEAKDLRAQNNCEDSYAKDRAGMDRCLAAYRAAKEGRYPGTVASSVPASESSTLTPEMALKVKAIASAAVEQSNAVPVNKAPTEAAARSNSSIASLVLVGALGIVLLGVGGFVILRREV